MLRRESNVGISSLLESTFGFRQPVSSAYRVIIYGAVCCLVVPVITMRLSTPLFTMTASPFLAKHGLPWTSSQFHMLVSSNDSGDYVILVFVLERNVNQL
jgi:hypothetical protein